MPKNMNKCIGCGVLLQTNDPNNVGYIKDAKQSFCMNCFRLMHYGEGADHHHPENLPTFHKDALIIVVSSILYLDTLLTSEIKRLGDEYQVLHLINQIDLLPKQTKMNDLLQQTKRQLKMFRVSYHDIVLMSALNPFDITQLKSYLKTLKVKEVYLIGLQNSGKTTLFKALTGNKGALAMKKAALTQRMLKDQFDQMTIYDTPGLYQSGYLHEFFPYDVYKRLLPEKPFKPRNGLLKKDDVLIIGGLIGVEVIKGEMRSVLYVSDEMKIHRTKGHKTLSMMQNSDVFQLTFERLKSQEYALKDEKKYQITLADFGLLVIKGIGTIRITTHPDLHYTLLESFIQ